MAGTKLHIVSCFALFALLVAPLAWQQTQVERTELPVDRIAALAWNRSRLATPARHVVRLFVSPDRYDASAASSAVAKLSTAFAHVKYMITPLVLTPQQQETLATLKLQPLDDALLTMLPTGADAFSLVLLCRQDAAAAEDTSVITVGKHRHAWSNACSPSDTSSLATALAELTQHHLFPAEDNAAEFIPAQSNRARVAVKYRLQFTLLQDGGDAQWGWDFDKLHKRYLTPVLEKLSSIAQLTIEHQTIHYARLAKEIHTDAATGVHYINADDLKYFKSTNDFLTTSVLADREQVLHFMATLPSRDHAPLVIKTETNDEATAFEIPGWGVAVILDPRELTDSSHAEAKELQRVVGRFISELRTLLGLPSFVKRQRLAQHHQTGLFFLPSPQHGVAQWELDVVVRSRLRRHVKSSIDTLQSILQLVTDMPELSVLDRVAQRITHAVDLVERVLAVADSDGDAAHDETTLLAIARMAVDEADAAYYDHTMIRQLYFPQEQLLGVFAPLLAPLLLPFFFGWIREVKQLRAKRQAKAKAMTSQ